jgi:hypothetical protein
MIVFLSAIGIGYRADKKQPKSWQTSLVGVQFYDLSLPGPIAVRA